MNIVSANFNSSTSSGQSNQVRNLEYEDKPYEVPSNTIDALNNDGTPESSFEDLHSSHTSHYQAQDKLKKIPENLGDEENKINKLEARVQELSVEKEHLSTENKNLSAKIEVLEKQLEKRENLIQKYRSERRNLEEEMRKNEFA